MPLQSLLQVVIVILSLMTRQLQVTALPVTTSQSHLRFYLTVEKQLVPDISNLVAGALNLFKLTCGAESQEQDIQDVERCLAAAEAAPAIAAIDYFPSKAVFNKEGRKVFGKHLLKDVYRLLNNLVTLLRSEFKSSDFVSQVAEVRDQLQEELETQYRAKLTTALPDLARKAKRKFTRACRSEEKDGVEDNDVTTAQGPDGGDREATTQRREREHDLDSTQANDVDDEDSAPVGGDDDSDEEDTAQADDAGTSGVQGEGRRSGRSCRAEYQRRLTFTAWRQVQRVKDVMDYLVRLSWMAAEKDIQALDLWS